VVQPSMQLEVVVVRCEVVAVGARVRAVRAPPGEVSGKHTKRAHQGTHRNVVGQQAVVHATRGARVVQPGMQLEVVTARARVRAVRAPPGVVSGKHTKSAHQGTHQNVMEQQAVVHATRGARVVQPRMQLEVVAARARVRAVRAPPVVVSGKHTKRAHQGTHRNVVGQQAVVHATRGARVVKPSMQLEVVAAVRGLGQLGHLQG